MPLDMVWKVRLHLRDKINTCEEELGKQRDEG